MLGDEDASGSFWKYRRVIVAGGNGFLGKYLVRILDERGAGVFVADIERYDLRHLEDTRRARRWYRRRPGTSR